MTNKIISDKTYKYAEIFYSFQGEGKYTGIPHVWLRFFGCNLQCDGFGQEDPTDPLTYILPHKDLDVSQYNKVEDLPVFSFGCDSSYSWSRKYRHLMKDETVRTIANNLEFQMAHTSNPQGFFKHPQTGQQTHLAFTGGEPMLNQDAMTATLNCMEHNMPRNITIETNGTRPITDDMADCIRGLRCDGTEWFWSVSPKLLSTSGELFKRAIKPDVLKHYNGASSAGQLKYVVNGTDESWREVEEATKLYRDAGVNWPVYIMAVGATKEQQEENVVGDIAMEAMKRGYYFSGRLHCAVFGNQVGT